MKKLLFIFIANIIAMNFAFSQGAAINNSGVQADPSAILDISSTTAGLLIPRMTQAERIAISSPAQGLLVFQTDNTAGYWYFDGTVWTQAIGPQGIPGATGPIGCTTPNYVLKGLNSSTVTCSQTPIFESSTAPYNVGIGTTNPNALLDVNGSVAYRGAALSLSTNNNDVVLGNNSFFRITGPTGAFNITGLAGGSDGRIVTLYNTTAQAMTISNESSSSTGANRIYTLTGTDIVTPAGPNAVQLQYDAVAARWILIGGQNLSSSGGSSGGLTGIITLTNTTSSTYTPTPGTKKIMIILLGGGGGGGGVNNQASAGGGGASGNYLIKAINNFSGTANYQCGAGGLAWGYGPGGNGGNTSFTYNGTTYTANGGGGGEVGNSGIIPTNGGTPGAISVNGDINGLGNYGQEGMWNQNGSIYYAGKGGASFIGPGAAAPTTYGGGYNAIYYGSGGSGTYNNTAPGGVGKQGIIYIYEYN